MKINIGVLPESELDLLRSAVHLVRPTEDKGFGVLVTCVDGIRTWQLNQEEMFITIQGEEHSFEGTFNLPGRLIIGAASFADADHSCHISVEGNFATATAPSGAQMKLELMNNGPDFKTFTEYSTVTAEVSFEEFQKIASLLGDPPLDFHDFQKLHSEPPVGQLMVEDGVIRLEKSWAYVNCSSSVVSIPAKTHGTGSFDLCHLWLDVATNRFFFMGEPKMLLSFDPTEGDYLHLKVDKLSMHFDRRGGGSKNFFSLVKAYLDEREIEHQVHSGGLIAANYKDIVVRMQLFDGPDPILHCTATVLHNVTPNVKLLRQLNKFNATRLGTSVWFDNGMIVVGADMRCDKRGLLTPVLEGLVREARDLGDLLSPVFGGTSSLTQA